MKNSSSRKGFTVVELVIVIAVIAVLAAVLIPTFSSLIKKANDSAYLQERTNQQIADLAEKVENQDFLSWADLEAKLAEELAKIEIPESATPDQMKTAVEEAAADAIAEYLKADTNNNTALTEAQVKAIVEKALEGQLTTAQVEGIVKAAVKEAFPGDDVDTGSSLTADQVKSIVEKALEGLNKETGITTEEMETAIKNAIAAQPGLQPTDVETIINNALAGFGHGYDISAGEIKNIIENAMGKAVATADEMAVKELNDALNGKTATTIEEVDEILTTAGFNMENGINAIRSGSTIYWFKDYNKIVLANGDTVAYPTEDTALVAAFKTAYADTSKVFNLAKLVDGSSVVVNGEIVGSLQDALNEGGEITLFNDIVAEDRLYIKADTVLNLNGHTIDFSSWTSGRLFNLETNGADLTINAEGSQIKFGGYGLVAMKGSTSQTATVKVTINGGTFEGAMDNGAFIKPVSNVNATVELNNVIYTDKTNLNNTNAGRLVSYITAINTDDAETVAFNLKVNGGKYDADCGFGGFGDGEFENVTITSRGYSIYGIGDFTVENSSLTTLNIHNVAGATPAATIAASGNVTVEVSGSTLNAGSGDAVALYSGNNEVIITGSTITGGYSEYDGNSTVTVDGVAKELTEK